MNMTDPIADMLTRIRNALTQKHETVSMPVSKEKKAIAKILKDEGFITDYVIDGEGVKRINNHFEIYRRWSKIISGLRRISKPGLRVYAAANELPRD